MHQFHHSKTAPGHDDTTTLLNSWYSVLLYRWSLGASDQKNVFMVLTVGRNTTLSCVCTAGMENNNSVENAFLEGVFSSYFRACTFTARQKA